MPPGNHRRAAGAFAVAVLAVLGTLAPAGAHGADGVSDALSPRLAELAEPDLRAAPPAVQARELSVAAHGAGSLVRDGRRVLAEVRFEGDTEVGVAGLRAAGAEVVHVSERYRTVTVSARPVDFPAIAAVPGVGGVTEVLAPLVSAECRGLVTSEGDTQLAAASARSSFNLDGSGVTVGILSDSFDTDASAPTHAANDVGSGDLPGPGNPCGRSEPVGVLSDYTAFGPDDPAQSDEGRAMAQIVHDLAPGAAIDFATAFQGEMGFAASIRALREGGADVIVDDVVYLKEPFFQDGPVAVAVDDVSRQGAAYFSAAGNSNEISGGRDVASWEVPAYRDSGACPAEVVDLSAEIQKEEEDASGQPALGLNPSHCLDFDPDTVGADDTYGITVGKGTTLRVVVQWAEPWHGVDTDLDAFLLQGGEVVDAGFDDNVGDTQRPFEFVAWENETGAAADVDLVLNRFSGAAPRLKLVLFSGGVPSEYDESSGEDVVGPTVFGHSGSSSAIGVGAVPFNSVSTVEPFSSRGPVTHYFGPVLGTAAAPEIAPTTISKPDLAATDGGASTFFGTLVSGVWRFFGTSAAAPHAAAVAALMQQANPSLPLSQLRLALSATASPVGAFGPNAAGAGLVDAFKAVSSVALPPTVSITESPPALGRSKRPSFGFSANRPVSFKCSIDGGGLQPCSSPFVPPAPLSDGAHGFVVSGTDVAGRTGRSPVVSFEIDSKRPRAFFRKRPPRTIRTRHRRAKAVFRFGASEKNVTFVCRVDGGLPRFCKPRFVKRFRVGKHVLRVRAKDLAGNVSRKPAVHRFRVKRRG